MTSIVGAWRHAGHAIVSGLLARAVNKLSDTRLRDNEISPMIL